MQRNKHTASEWAYRGWPLTALKKAEVMTPPEKKKRTISDILSDPAVARRQDMWLRDLSKARTGQPFEGDPDPDDFVRPIAKSTQNDHEVLLAPKHANLKDSRLLVFIEDTKTGEKTGPERWAILRNDPRWEPVDEDDA